MVFHCKYHTVNILYPKMCCPRSIQATHACHNKVSNIFFGLWSPKPFVVASIGVGPVFPCNKNHRSNEQLSRLATVSWKRAASLSVADVHKMWCTAEKIFMRHVNLSKESILAKFAAFFFAKTFHSLEDQTVGKGEILSWKSQGWCLSCESVNDSNNDSSP